MKKELEQFILVEKNLTYLKNDSNEAVLAFKADNDLSKAVAF